MSFYLWAMRAASMILLAMAVLIIAATVAGNVLVYMQASTSQYSSQPDYQFIQILLSVAASMQNAALPLFGAAALWRADRWLAGQGAAE